MQWLFILVAVFWVVISIAGNKKKQQAKAEAEKRAAEAARQAQSAAPPPQRPQTVYSPYYPDAQPQRPVQQPQRPVPRQSAAQPARAAQAPVQPARTAQEPRMQQTVQTAPQSRMQASPTSTLTEIRQTQRHTLAPSGKGGHAHQETSLTGFEPECGPESAAAEPEAEREAYAGMPVFSWQPNAVLNGMLYAEILGKPKALRQ